MTLKSNLFKIIFVLIFIFIFGSLNFSVYAASSSSSEVASDFNNYVNKDKFFYLANENEKYDYIISEYIDFCEKNNIACNEEDYNTVYENFYCSLFDLDLEDQSCTTGLFDWLKKYDTYYIKTPNNSDVTCYSFRKDYKETVIDDMNEKIENNYGQYVEVIGTSTRKYNCHSYALYSQDVNNNYYWINDPSPFYEDGSYCEVLDGQIKEGDIICYINPNNPNCKYLHSGIVTYVPDKYVYDENMINLENILVTSKWADHCLVEHSVVNCPYYPNDIFVEDTNSYSVASNVKFYRLHNNDLEYSVDDNNHNLVCTGCKKIYSSSNHSNQIEESNNIESNICTICDKMNYIKTENFHCRSTIDNYSFLLYKNQTISHEINITCNNYYYFECESTQEINFKLYDQYNNLVSDSLYITTNYGYKYWITATLEEGKYYIQFENHTQNTNITYSGEKYSYSPENISNVESIDALSHLHNNKNEFTLSPSLSGVFLLELFAKIDGEYINPQGEFVIKNSSGEIVDKMKFSDYYHPAQSIENANNIMFYADEWGDYTICLEVADFEYQELILNVNEISDFTVYDMNEDDEYISSDNIETGDFAYIYNLDRIGTYDISFEYNGQQADKMLFVLFETNENGEYVFKTDFEINKDNNIYELVEVLTQSKNLLLCVFDSEGLGNIDINIVKRNSSSFTIITDPSIGMSGSEVKLNGGILGGTTMTKGFTRICYLGSDAPDSRSRYTYYNWYSTNTNVAKVSEYGTITAVGVGTTTIQCVYKADSSIKATLEITVYDYFGTDYIYLNYGMDVRVGGTISGTEVTSGSGIVIPVSYNPEVTIHRNKTRLICLGDDSPSTSIQDFAWESSNSSIASVSSFGTITANITGEVIITGTYKYNSYYKVIILVKVV